MTKESTSVNSNSLAGTRLLKLSEVKERTKLSHATIYRWMEAKKFPRPIRLGEACVRWNEADLENWISHRAEAAQ